jgi:thioredoxin
MPRTSLERIGPESFDSTQLRRPGTWAVAFLADWCPFCRSFAPRFRRLASHDRYGLLVADLTSEESPLWDQFGIEIVPTVIVFRDGHVVARFDGRAGYGLDATHLKAIEAAASESRE